MQKRIMDKTMINIGSKNYRKWVRLKEKFKFKTDVDFADYLLQWTEKNLGLSLEDKECLPECVDPGEKRLPDIEATNPFEENKVENEDDTSARGESAEVNATPTQVSRICSLCDAKHKSEKCPVESPSTFLPDSAVLENMKEDYAKSSLPVALELRKSESGEGIFALKEIKRSTEFGPLIGVPIKEMEISDDNSMKSIWEVKTGSYLNTSSTANSNWLRWIKPAPSRSKRNIVPVEREDKLFFVTIKTININDELLYWADMKGPWAMKKMEKTNCGGCNIQFDHAMYYRLHCAVFHDASLSLTVRKYHCKVCGEVVLGKQNIMKHALSYHNGKGAYQCQFCSKFFLRLNYLEMHKNYGCSANPKRTRPLCDYCGRKFCQPQKLKVHIKRMHSDMSEVLKEFQCPSCLKLLGSRAALQRHTKEVHKRPSCLSCSKCSKSFQNKSNLKIHMLTHSGVKPFKCQESSCGAAFTTKQCLQFHYKKVHGLSEDRYPNIVRSVDYTFESYSGTKDDLQENSSSENDSQPINDKDEDKCDESSNESTIECVTETTNKKWVETEDSYRKIEICPQPEPSNASLLVEAALYAAEKDIRPDSEINFHDSSPETGCPSPVYKTQYRSPPPEYAHEIRNLDENAAQNLTKYKYDEDPREIYHGFMPRYAVYDYQQDIVRAMNLQTDLSMQRNQLINQPQLENERILSTNYQSIPSYVSAKSQTYNHYSIYY